MGAAHARMLVGEGAKVVIGDILDEKGKALADELGNAARYVHLDVTQPDDWEAAVSTALNDFGALNVLVNNAGIVALGQIGKFDMAKWQKVIDVNLTGAFLCAQAVGREMIKRRCGRIINIASIAGLMGQDPRIVRTIAYNATKGGVVNFTRALAAEWGQHGITVNAICPGFFPSKMTKATLDTTGELIRDWTPNKRFGNDEDLKGLAVLLASEASRHITGQAIAVDGGATVI
jgi:3alpha(or 20beta)-hydroxysteroid dehydrogenase